MHFQRLFEFAQVSHSNGCSANFVAEFMKFNLQNLIFNAKTTHSTNLNSRVSLETQTLGHCIHSATSNFDILIAFRDLLHDFRAFSRAIY